MSNLFKSINIVLFSILIWGCSEGAKESADAASKEESVRTTSVEAQAISKDPSAQSADANNKPSAAVFNLAQVKDTYKQVNFLVSDISERSYDGGNALAISFSVPLNPSDNFSKYLQVSSSKGVINGSWILSDSGKIAYFEFIDPNTSYDVEVDWHITSALGGQLSSTKKANIRTRKIVPVVSFASSGHFLPLDLHSGLPVTTLNIPEVNINFHRIKTKDVAFVVRMLGDRQNQGQYQLRKMAEAGEFVHSGRYELPAENNKRRTFNIPLHEIPALNEAGIYVAVMDVPGTYENLVQATYFSVTDLGVHVRRYERQLDVHVNSLKSAKELAGVQITLLKHNGVVLSKKLTDANGASTFRSVDKNASYLIANYQDSYTILPLKKAALDLSEFDLGKRPYQEQEFFIYSERDLYRPGDTINFSALLRDFDGNRARIKPLKAKLKRADGQTVKEFSWRGNNQAYYEYQFKIDKSAQVGSWTLEVSGVSSKKVKYQFKVEEFMPERLKLTFNPNNESKQVFNTIQDVNVPVLGEYLYGAPAAGNRFDARIRIGLLRHPFKEYKDFFFGDENETQWNDSFDDNNSQMDAEGKITVSIPSRWQGAKSPLSVSVFGSLFESGGRPVTRHHMAKVLPNKGVIGIRPVFEKFAPARGQAEFELIKTNADGSKLASQNLDVVLVREDRRYFWEYSRQRGWHYEHTDKEVTELSMSSNIKAGKLAKINLPVDYGRYRLEITDTDTGYKTSYKFKAGRDWYGWWRDAQKPGQAARPDKVSLALDKPHYNTGDTVQLTLVPPAAGESIIVVEADKPLWSTRLAIPKEGMVVNIPVQESWNRHDIYISVVHLQPANNQDKITPTRSFGLVHLPLDRTPRKLSVDFDAPDTWLPNQKVKLKLDVFSGIEGDRQSVDKAWLTLAAVDVGILNITDYEIPMPHDFFFGKRRYNIDSLDMYNDLIALNSNKLARQRYGGDAGDLSRGGKQAQSEVQIVSLFSGLVDVKQGSAMVELDLPDFNGRIKLMAVAFTEDSVGSAEQEVTVAAPLVTQLSMPRFVAWGDQSTLALDLSNLSGESQTLKVSLSTDGPLLLDENTQNLSLTLGDKTKETLQFPFSVGYSGTTSNIELSVTGLDEYPINRSWKLNARSPYPAITQQIRSVLKENESLTLEAKALVNYIPETLQASLSVSNVIDLELRNQMDHLLRYPYGCLEQSTSSTYPWVFATEDVLNKMDLKNTTGKTSAENIELGLDRILKKQKKNGSFGLWSNSDKNEQHWLTAYVGDFITDARQQGFQVNDSFYDKTMKRLGEYLKNSSSYSARWSEKPEHYRFAYRAYAGYVLSRHNKAGLGHLRKLAEQRADSQSFLPLIHLGLALHNQGDTKTADQLLDKALSNVTRGRFYLADYGSEIRDKALAIHLLTRHKKRSDDVMELAVSVAHDLKGRHYLSTQERNALFLAGIALEMGAHITWQADLAYSDAVKTIQGSGGFTRFMQGSDVVNGISLSNQSDSLLYSTLAYSGYSVKAPIPQDGNGIRVQRTYFTTEGVEITPTELNVGDMVLVALRINTDARMPDLMVVDLLPAGLEIENQNLKHSAKLDNIKIDGRTISDWQQRSDIVHQEYRDDRYVAAIDVGWQKEVYGFYLARAVTPGEYNIPAPYAEDMYDPETFAIGETLNSLKIK